MAKRRTQGTPKRKHTNITKRRTQKRPPKRYLSMKLSGGNTIEGLMDALPNPDRLLEQIRLNNYENMYNIFDDILNDEHVSSVMEVLEAGVLRHRPFIKSMSEKEKKTYEWEFKSKKLAMRDVIKQIVEGKFKGMAAFEVMWENEDGREVVKELIPLELSDFTANGNGTLVYKNTFNTEDPRYKHKFLIYRNKKYKNPYGVAEILKCYYPWQFKKGGWRFWLTTTEKYGVPTLVVEYDEAQTDNTGEVEADLADAFFNIENDSVVVTNNLKKLHVVESKAKAMEFKTLINMCEESISKVIVGTPILTSSGDGGNKALAEIQANLNYRYKVQNLIADISETINTLIEYSIELNTTDGINKNETEYGIEYVDIQDFEKMIKVMDRGVAISKKVLYKHVPEPENKEDVFLAPIPMNTQNNQDMRGTDEKTATKETETETSDNNDGEQKNNPD